MAGFTGGGGGDGALGVSVETGEIDNLAVTEPKIGNGAVNGFKVNSNIVDDSTIELGNCDLDLPNVSLLVQSETFNGDTNFPETSQNGHTIVAQGGTIEHDSAQAFFGTTSVRNSGSKVLRIDNTDNEVFNLGTGNWSFEILVRFTALPPNIVLFNMGGQSVRDLDIGLTSTGGNFRVIIEGTSYNFSTGGLSTNTWYYFGVTRNGNDLKAYLDGSQIGSTQDVTGEDIQTAGNIYIANDDVLGNALDGYFEELRLTKGVVRDVTSVPVEPFPATCFPELRNKDLGVTEAKLATALATKINDALEIITTELNTSDLQTNFPAVSNNDKWAVVRAGTPASDDGLYQSNGTAWVKRLDDSDFAVGARGDLWELSEASISYLSTNVFLTSNSLVDSLTPNNSATTQLFDGTAFGDGFRSATTSSVDIELTTATPIGKFELTFFSSFTPSSVNGSVFQLQYSLDGTTGWTPLTGLTGYSFPADGSITEGGSGQYTINSTDAVNTGFTLGVFTSFQTIAKGYRFTLISGGMQMGELRGFETVPFGDDVNCVTAINKTDAKVGVQNWVENPGAAGTSLYTYEDDEIVKFGDKLYINDSGSQISTGSNDPTVDTANWSEFSTGGTDADAIHDNVAGEINAITEKTTPVAADEVIIEDTEDSNNKKKVQISNLLLDDSVTTSKVKNLNITAGKLKQDIVDGTTLAFSDYDPCFSDVVLLVQSEAADGNTTFTDGSDSAHTVTPAGPEHDTDQFKFGTSSIFFPGTDDILTLGDSADWDFGTGDLTIEMFVRFTAVNANNYILSMGAGLARDISMNPGGGAMNVYIENTLHQFTWSPSTATWYHIALVRTGNDLKFYVDGTQTGSTADVTGVDIQMTTGAKIGTDSAGNNGFNGHMEEIRFSNVGRYTTTFTAPTVPFDDGTTVAEISVVDGGIDEAKLGTDSIPSNNWRIETSAYNAVAGDRIAADTNAVGAFTITLPASPNVGDTIEIKDYKQNWSSANLTLDRNTKNIEGAASNLVLSATDSIRLVYIDVTQGWIR